MDDKELQAKVIYLTRNCSFLVKRDILVEELAELLKETNSPRLHINKWSNDKILEEFSDVYLMLWQMCVYLGEDNIENYLQNFEKTENLEFNRVEMTFLEKAMDTIWVTSKLRRQENVISNSEIFRECIFLLADHMQMNIRTLKETKSIDIINKIREIVISKVKRQEIRVMQEAANGSYIVEESK